jgi:alkanesulfonate monooxygenase SsuD/methylene tetrahydromethanopterin reductase-like flavin-dependent oxidoreductase (luciferase family)
MKLGIGIGNFSWPVATDEIASVISRIAVTADEAGFDSLWVMDHFFQIRITGLPPESPMFEAYATLGFLAGLTRRIKLGTIVTSVAYRHPGVLVKSVTSLDVLSGGRVFFGVGAGAPWNVPPAGPGTAFEAEGSASRSRRSPSGSSGSRNCCRSRTRCGAETSGLTRAGTTSWSAR